LSLVLIVSVVVASTFTRSVTDWPCSLSQDNPRTTAIKAVAKANDLELNIVEADTAAPSVEHAKAHKLGKIPAFIGEDGFALSECIAIAVYCM
jgi:elongation factor 1-gamma